MPPLESTSPARELDGDTVLRQEAKAIHDADLASQSGMRSTAPSIN